MSSRCGIRYGGAELYGIGPARAAMRREIDSLIRVHPYSGPTTAQSITAPSGYHQASPRADPVCGGLLFPRVLRASRVHANEAEVRPTLHVRSGNGVYVRHERTFTSFLGLPHTHTYTYVHFTDGVHIQTSFTSGTRSSFW